MKVSALGEFGLINLLAEMISKAQDTGAEPYKKLLIGIGDDAAAWKGNTGTQLVTTDSLFQDVHFRLETTPWHELGWKSLAVNLSDIAAMGGAPEYAVISMAVPPDTEVDGDIGKLIIPAGTYALGHFEITGDQYPSAWKAIYQGWLPESGYQPDDRPCFEDYLNDPNEHPENKHIINICIPVKPL